SLTVTATSSNLTLVPNANIAIGGAGPTRTLTLTPAAGQSGTATITTTVNDGTMTASRPFTLTVSPPPMACTPRPAVLTQPIAGGGKLQVTIRATALEGLTNNRLHEIRFGDPGNGVGNLQNARVTLANQPHT